MKENPEATTNNAKASGDGVQTATTTRPELNSIVVQVAVPVDAARVLILDHAQRACTNCIVYEVPGIEKCYVVDDEAGNVRRETDAFFYLFFFKKKGRRGLVHIRISRIGIDFLTYFSPFLCSCPRNPRVRTHTYAAHEDSN